MLCTIILNKDAQIKKMKKITFEIYDLYAVFRFFLRVKDNMSYQFLRVNIAFYAFKNRRDMYPLVAVECCLAACACGRTLTKHGPSIWFDIAYPEHWYLGQAEDFRTTVPHIS